MKILQISQDWFKTELREAGHEVVSCGADQHFDIRLHSPFLNWREVVSLCPWTPEAVIFYDNSVPIFISGIEELEIPTIYYSVDAQHHISWQRFFSGVFDHIFVAQRDFILQFMPDLVKITWLPLWATHLPELSTEKRYEAVFVGTLNPQLNPERVKFFEKLSKIAPVTCLQGDYWTIFPHARIVVNQTVRKELNFRVFEAMSSGVPLVTDRVENGLFDLFKEGIHLCTYEQNNPDDAAQKIMNLLADKQGQDEIGASGRELILKKHRPINRALEVLSTLDGVRARPSRSRFGLVANFITLGLFLEREGRNPLPVYTEALRLIEDGMLKGEEMNIDLGQVILQALAHHDRVSKGAKAALLLQELTKQYHEWFSSES